MKIFLGNYRGCYYSGFKLRQTEVHFQAGVTSFLCEEIEEQDSRLAPAYFLPNYRAFDQFLQTVRKREYCFQSSFQRFSTNINSLTDFYKSWRYRVIRAPEQSTKSEAFF